MFTCFSPPEPDMMGDGFAACVLSHSTPAEWTIFVLLVLGIAWVAWMARLGEFEIKDV